MKISFLRFTIALSCIFASFAADGQRSTRSLKGNSCRRFTRSSVKGKFSYSNNVADVGSFGIFQFDGAGGIASSEGLTVNLPPNRTLVTVKLKAPLSYYTVGRDGRGQLAMSLGEPGAPFYDPPLIHDFVATETDGCQVLRFDSFAQRGGLANQLVAPTWSLISK
jgi:hypothetical protein